MLEYKWKPIEDLPTDWMSMASPELKGLSATWAEQSAKLKESDVVKEFNERLAREWAIETGIVEQLYSIDRGITLLLIEKGIHASLLPHGSTDKPAD